jgi:radical SAM-linked protein
LAGRYKIHGSVRFLSHQEALKVVQRALLRSGADLIYSQGYNPRPKLSLPLPKSVGIASEDELFCAQISCQPVTDGRPGENGDLNKELFKSIAAQMPEGFCLTELTVHNGRVTYQPLEAEYLVFINDAEELVKVSAQADKLNGLIRAGEEMTIERTVDEKGSVKTVDVGKFLKSFEQVPEGIKVVSKITDKGTIRPDEILRLLGLEPERIGISMVRKKVNWQMN